MATMRKQAYNDAQKAASEGAIYSKEMADKMMNGVSYQQALLEEMFGNAQGTQQYVQQQQQDIYKKTGEMQQQGASNMANSGYNMSDPAFQEYQAQTAAAGATASNKVAQQAQQDYINNIEKGLNAYGNTVGQTGAAAKVGQGGYEMQIGAANSGVANANSHVNNILQGMGIIASALTPGKK